MRLSRASTQNLQQQQTKRDTANNDSDAPRSRLLSTKSSLSRLAPSKSRSRTEPSTQNMTVETETVSSIPQTPIATNQGDRAASARNDPNGSIKLKPSNETIRPKRERKWTTRKPTVVAAGNGMYLSSLSRSSPVDLSLCFAALRLWRDFSSFHCTGVLTYLN